MFSFSNYNSICILNVQAFVGVENFLEVKNTFDVAKKNNKFNIKVNGMKLEMPPINDKIEGRMNCPIEVNPELLQLENYIRISSLELEEVSFV